MKKYLIAFLLSLSCAFAVTAVGCVNDSGTTESSSNSESSSPEPEYEGTRKVTFQNGEGYTFVSDTESGSQFNAGEYLTFSVDFGGFYQDCAKTAIVYVNETPVAQNTNGEYSVLITEDVTLRVEGVKKDVSNMDGSGTQESPFVITKPIDLIHIANQVNKGVAAYVQGWYIIANPIDCKGEELKVIGDLSTENSYFSGNIASNYDAETGEVYDCTISNFTINSQNANYVGLFGTVYADLSVAGSGQFYGIQLDNFTITAGLNEHQGESKSIAAGSLIGYGVGANMILCEATNGELFLEGDNSYYSYGGGLIGYQQAFYMEAYDTHFSSEIIYSHADVDVTVLNGLALYAGGIAGYICTNYPVVSIAAIHNSYATGDVSGALRSGGLVGGLGQYAVISNCYATGNVFATSPYTSHDKPLADEEYWGAYAGGLVGYAENDTIAHDSFFAGTTYAASTEGSAYDFTNNAIAGGAPAGTNSVVSREYLAINCISNPDLSNLDYFSDTLGWGEYNWIFKTGKYPTTNTETTSGSFAFTMTLIYVAPDGTEIKVNGKTSELKTYFDNTSTSNNAYNSFGGFIAGGGLKTYYAADNAGYRSFGYFFDEACTQKVPNGYLPMKNVTLYIGFEAVNSIVGSYYFTSNGKTIELEFQENGTVRYTDGATEQESYFSFDGENIIIETARLARYYDGEIIVDENDTTSVADANFDMNRYVYYDFSGKLVNGTLYLYDGIYFTKDAPLTASSTKPETQNYDEFKGSWTKTANINKTYTFDGLGNWTYKHIAYTREGFGYIANVLEEARGTYTVQNGTISFVHAGETFSGSFNSDGFLELNGNNSPNNVIFYRQDSYVGTWFTNGFTLTLNGLNENGTGSALVVYDDNSELELVYEASETNGYVALYYPHSDYFKDALFGYFTYNASSHSLTATLYDSNNTTTGYTQYSLRVKDDLNGIWITSFGAEVEFDFNGLGLYSEGSLVIYENDTETTIPYALNNKMEGDFSYKGVDYTFKYDENSNTIVLEIKGSGIISAFRKDVLADQVFVDDKGNEYVFNGRSPNGEGRFTINGVEHHYIANNDGSWDVDFNGDKLVRSGNCYKLTLSGVVYNLYVKNDFMGNWAISGEFSLLKIGASDLNGNISATFRGYNVTMSKYDSNILTFEYTDREYAGMRRTYYVYIVHDDSINDNVLVLTENDNLFAGDYLICSRVNELYGTWNYQKMSGMKMRFDGVTSSYAYGVVELSYMNSETMYNYNVKENGTLLWSQEALAGSISYYGIKVYFPGDEGYEEAYSQRDAWIRTSDNAVLIRFEVDSLYLTEAKDELGNEYFFDGEGGILVNGALAYSYEYRNVTYHGNDTATIIVKDLSDNKYYELFLDYTDRSNTTVDISEEVDAPLEN